METENPTKMKFFFLIIFLAVAIAFGLTWYFFGGQGILKFILYFTIVLFVLAIIFLIIYAIVWLFSTHRVDTIHVNKQRVLKACLANPPESDSTLWFKGSEEWEYKQIGFITGVCMILHKVKGKDQKEMEQQEYAISFKKSKGIIAKIFGKHEIVRVLRHERTSLNSDKVFLKAMSFAPEKFGFFFLPNRFRESEVKKILASEVRDVTLQEILKEEVNIANEAIAISPRHQKELEKTNMQSIKSGAAPSGQQ